MSRRPRLVAPPLEEGSLPRQLPGFRSPIVWGVLLLVAIEGTVIGLLVMSWFYLRMGAGPWPPPGVPLPDLLEPTVAQGLLLLSPIPAWLGLRGLVRGRRWAILVGLPVGLLMAAGYLVIEARAWLEPRTLWNAHVYGSIEWTMSGYAALHVAVVLVAGAFVQILALRGHFGAHRYTGIQALLLYWAFAAVASLLLYATRYLSLFV